MKAKDILKRYIFSTLGMLLVALGIAVSIVANLGTSPLNAASYAMAEGLEGLSVGTCNFIVYAIFVLLQFVVLGKDFKAADLLQLVAKRLLSDYTSEQQVLGLATVSWAGRSISADCKSPDTICCQFVTTRICRPAGRIKVVLIGDDLGL